MTSKEQQLILGEKALDDVRAILVGDGGDILLRDISEDGTIVYVQLLGMCVGCPVSDITLQGLVLRSLKKHLPSVAQVVNVDV